MFKFVIYDTCEADRSANNIIVDHFSGRFPRKFVSTSQAKQNLVFKGLFLNLHVIVEEILR